MNIRIWSSAVALSIYFLSSWAQACGLRDNGATMTDPVTGIEIQKCAVGQRWAGTGCGGDPVGFQYSEAVARYGKGEWRLPTKEEAEKVINRSRTCRIEEAILSTPYTGDKPADAWIVNFHHGNIFPFRNHYGLIVRLVRTGK